MRAIESPGKGLLDNIAMGEADSMYVSFHAPATNHHNLSLTRPLPFFPPLLLSPPLRWQALVWSAATSSTSSLPPYAASLKRPLQIETGPFC